MEIDGTHESCSCYASATAFFLSIEFVPCYIVALVLILPLFIRFVSIYFAFFSSFFFLALFLFRTKIELQITRVKLELVDKVNSFFGL